MNNMIYFSVLKAAVQDPGSAKVKWGPRSGFHTSHCVVTRQKGQGSSAVSLLRALISFMRSLPCWPNQLPKPPRPKTIVSGIRISTMNSGGITNSQTTLSESKGPYPHCVCQQRLSEEHGLPALPAQWQGASSSSELTVSKAPTGIFKGDSEPQNTQNFLLPIF